MQNTTNQDLAPAERNESFTLFSGNGRSAEVEREMSSGSPIWVISYFQGEDGLDRTLVETDWRFGRDGAETNAQRWVSAGFHL